MRSTVVEHEEGTAVTLRHLACFTDILMAQKTISILGCGYLGLPVARALLAKGWRVRGSTTRVQRLRVLLDAGIDPFLLELTPTLQGRALVDFFSSPTILVNFPPGRRRSDVETFLPAAMREILVRMANTSHLIFASSTSVYGEGVVDEKSLAPPRTPSGRALRHAESLLTARGDFTTTVLRFGGLYGYARTPGRFMRCIANGAAHVNLVHRDDAVAVTVLVAENLEAAAGTYNVVADSHPTKAAFYTQAARWLGNPPPAIEFDSAIPDKYVRNDWLRQRLGYRFKVPDPMVRAP